MGSLVAQYLVGVPDETTSLPAVQPAPKLNREAMLRTGRAIRYNATLLPWMLAYAEWLVLECVEPPSLTQRCVRARGLSRTPLTNRLIKSLEAREDFADYCDELAKGPLEQARAKFASAFPTYVEAHRKALDAAASAASVALPAQGGRAIGEARK